MQDEQWFVEQKVADSGVKICTSLTPKYGFASKTSNAFASFEVNLRVNNEGRMMEERERKREREDKS